MHIEHRRALNNLSMSWCKFAATDGIFKFVVVPKRGLSLESPKFRGSNFMGLEPCSELVSKKISEPQRDRNVPNLAWLKSRISGYDLQCGVFSGSANVIAMFLSRTSPLDVRTSSAATIKCTQYLSHMVPAQSRAVPDYLIVDYNHPLRIRAALSSSHAEH